MNERDGVEIGDRPKVEMGKEKKRGKIGEERRRGLMTAQG